MIFGNTKAPFKGKKINLQKIAQSAPDPVGEPEGMEESLNALAEQVEIAEAMPINEESPMTCQVYGFMSGGSKTSVSRLLLCGLANGELRHVAVVDSGKLKGSAKQKLRAYLDANTRSEPLVDTKYRGTWVNPVVAVVVKFDGWSPKNTMQDPEIVRVGRAGTTTKSLEKQPVTSDTEAEAVQSSAAQ